jgi:hypothetical protein
VRADGRAVARLGVVAIGRLCWVAVKAAGGPMAVEAGGSAGVGGRPGLGQVPVWLDSRAAVRLGVVVDGWRSRRPVLWVVLGQPV